MAASFVLTAAGAGALLLLARLSLFDDAVQASGSSSEPARTSQDQSVALSTASVGSITPASRELPTQADEPTQDEGSARAPLEAADTDTLVRQRVAALQTQDLLGSEPTDAASQHDWVTIASGLPSTIQPTYSRPMIERSATSGACLSRATVGRACW
jgi:hypothetical protein